MSAQHFQELFQGGVSTKQFKLVEQSSFQRVIVDHCSECHHLGKGPAEGATGGLVSISVQEAPVSGRRAPHLDPKKQQEKVTLILRISGEDALFSELTQPPAWCPDCPECREEERVKRTHKPASRPWSEVPLLASTAYFSTSNLTGPTAESQGAVTDSKKCVWGAHVHVRAWVPVCACMWVCVSCVYTHTSMCMCACVYVLGRWRSAKLIQPSTF